MRVMLLGSRDVGVGSYVGGNWGLGRGASSGGVGKDSWYEEWGAELIFFLNL